MSVSERLEEACPCYRGLLLLLLVHGFSEQLIRLPKCIGKAEIEWILSITCKTKHSFTGTVCSVFRKQGI